MNAADDPLQFYYALLRSAFEASEAVDKYDLHSDVPASVMEWERLKFVDAVNQQALCGHVRSMSAGAFTHAVQGSRKPQVEGWIPFEDRPRPDADLGGVMLSLDRVQRIMIKHADEAALGRVFAWLMGQVMTARGGA